VLKRIWLLSDIDKDGQLDMDEFIVAIHLSKLVNKGLPLPGQLPATLMPVSKINSPF